MKRFIKCLAIALLFLVLSVLGFLFSSLLSNYCGYLGKVCNASPNFFWEDHEGMSQLAIKFLNFEHLAFMVAGVSYNLKPRPWLASLKLGGYLFLAQFFLTFLVDRVVRF